MSNTAILLVHWHLYSFRTGLTSLSFYSLRYVFRYTFALSIICMYVTEATELETFDSDLYSQSLPVNPVVHKNVLDFNVQ